MFGKECIYILIDPKQPGFLKIGYGKFRQGLKTEDLIIGYEAGMEVAFYKIVKMARIFSEKINKELHEKSPGVNIKKDMFCISTDKCINIIKNLYGKFSEEATNLKFIPEESISFTKLSEERQEKKSWWRIGEFNNDKIFISLPVEVKTTNLYTMWIMRSFNLKRNPRSFNSKIFGSEISKVTFFLQDVKYECNYYSVFEKSMGTGALLFDDIVFPRINLNSFGVEAGHFNLVHNYLVDKYITKTNDN
jgi:hypothetical protein